MANHRTRILLALAILASLSVNCGGGDEIAEPPTISIKAKSIQVDDFQNNGNSSDIKVTFTKPADRKLVGSYRIVVLKASSVDLTLEQVNALSSDEYVEIQSNASSIGIELPEALNDVDGDLISEEVMYKVVIWSLGNETDDELSESSAEFELSQTNLVKTLVQNVNGGSGGMAIDATGNVYMADFGRTLGGPPGNKVFKISAEGSVSIFASGLNGASGNDFDSQGNLYQSNIAGQSISKITPDGAVSTFASGDPIVNTVGISIDENDVLFVADCDGHKLLKVDTDGSISIFATSSLFACPNGLTRDDSGNLYASNFYNGNLLKITPEGVVSVLTTLPGNNNGHVTFFNGFLYVIARTANQIYKVSLSGSSELFAGSGLRGGVDGSAMNARFSLPNDLIFSHDGTKLYINDVIPNSGNDIAPCRIRVIEIVED